MTYADEATTAYLDGWPFPITTQDPAWMGQAGNKRSIS